MFDLFVWLPDTGVRTSASLGRVPAFTEQRAEAGAVVCSSGHDPRQMWQWNAVPEAYQMFALWVKDTVLMKHLMLMEFGAP